MLEKILFLHLQPWIKFWNTIYRQTIFQILNPIKWFNKSRQCIKLSIKPNYFIRFIRRLSFYCFQLHHLIEWPLSILFISGNWNVVYDYVSASGVISSFLIEKDRRLSIFCLSKNMSSKLLVLLIVAVSCCWSVKGLVVCPRLAAYSPCICAENGGNPGTIFLLCSNRNLTDSTASHILDAFLTSPNVSPISIIE